MPNANLETKKPKVKLTGTDGNVFALLGLCCTALKRANQEDKAAELRTKVFAAKSYDEARALMCDYCDVR